MKITVAEIKTLNPPFVYCSTVSVWWSHDKNDFEVSAGGLPTDPYGNPLVEMDFEQWVDWAETTAREQLFLENWEPLYSLCHAKNYPWLRQQPGYTENFTIGQVLDLLSKLEVI